MNEQEEAPKLCTTSGKPIDEHTREIDPVSGMQKDYVVLCPNERAKGFMRPYRDSYEHTGRSICGNLIPDDDKRLGGPRTICAEEYGHTGECGAVFRTVDQPEHAEILDTHLIGGCGTVTTMGRALSETYARDPSFYGGTFCAGCRTHFPVNEFRWTADGEVVGS